MKEENNNLDDEEIRELKKKKLMLEIDRLERQVEIDEDEKKRLYAEVQERLGVSTERMEIMKSEGYLEKYGIKK